MILSIGLNGFRKALVWPPSIPGHLPSSITYVYSTYTYIWLASVGNDTVKHAAHYVS